MDKYGLLVDLDTLKNDYHQGHSGMGHPSRGYYITTWRGMESLQSYATSEAIAAWSGDVDEFNVREVMVSEDGTQYEMRAWTERNFLNRMNDSLFDMVDDVSVDRGYWDENDGSIQEAVINEVFGGQMDRLAVTAGLSNPDRHISFGNTQLAMQYDILRAQHGHTDMRAKAGAHAYQNVLARDAKLVNFDVRNMDDITAHDGETFQQITERQWMQQAGKAYINYILDSYDDSTPDVVNVADVKNLVHDLSWGSYGQKLADEYGREKWDALEGYLKKDIMFFIDSKNEVRFDAGMGYLNEVHNAVDLTPEEDLNYDESYTYDLETDSVSPTKTKVEDVEEYDDDDWDFGF